MECFIVYQSDTISKFSKEKILEIKETRKNPKIILVNNTSLFNLKFNFDILYITNLQNLLYLSNIDINKFKKIIFIDKTVVEDQLYNRDQTTKNKVHRVLSLFKCEIVDRKYIYSFLCKYFEVNYLELFSWNNVSKSLVKLNHDDKIIVSTSDYTPTKNISVDKPILKKPNPCKNVKKILLIGNDSYLNKFAENFDNLDFDSFTTIGINRSFMKIKTEYVSFLDIEIMEELIHFRENNMWINDVKPIFNLQFLEKRYKDYLEKSNNPCKTNPPLHWDINKRFLDISTSFNQIWPSSIKSKISPFIIPTLLSTMHLCVNQLFKEYDCHFYITCSSFKIENGEHHFWKVDDVGKPNLVCANIEMYKPRLDLFFNTLRNAIKRNKWKVFSIQSNSKLNEFCHYIDEAKFLKKSNSST